MEQTLYAALKDLRKNIPRLAELLKLDEKQDIASWTHIVDAKLLARFSPEFPVVAAVCGGGSSGKSTLFNSLLEEVHAPTGGRAGMNRRVLFSVPAKRAAQSGLLFALAQPFESEPERLEDIRELTRPGNPLYVLNRTASDNIVLLDTPDFDTGAKGRYVNRNVTRRALEASDILIYIFTNSNYNNRDNTDFISHMLTGIGRRKCFLIYRVYPSFAEQEITEHAMTVARGIYGDEAEKFLLGIYRADEDNRVAAGERFMRLRPVPSDGPEIMKALASIDTRELRFELHLSILRDVLQKSQKIFEKAKISLDELQLYFDALQTAQSHCVHDALKHFPMDRVLGRFARIWSQSDPYHIKFMRKTGALVELPLKVAFGAAGWIKDQLTAGNTRRTSPDGLQEKLDQDLTTAVTSMHLQSVGSHVSAEAAIADPVAKRMVERINRIRAKKSLQTTQNPRVQTSDDGTMFHFYVSPHPALLPQQQHLRDQEFKTILKAILSQQEDLMEIPREMDKDLEDLAGHLRSKMGLWTKISQTFWASLNVLPASVAITYVLSTGDPLGGAGIKVKLTGLIGAKDLYALVAVPVTTGLKKADQKQLEAMLGPIAQTWLNHKLKKVQLLFEQHITGGILQAANRDITVATEIIHAIEKNMHIYTSAVPNDD